MIFQRINLSDAEVVFSVAYNVAGATVTAGYAVVWDTSTADGIRVTKPATAVFSLLQGLANADIADSAYGKVQVYGYRASGYVTNDTSVAIVAGDQLVPVDGQWHLTRQAAGNAALVGGGLVYAGEAFATNATPAAVNQKVFIRTL